MCAAKAAALPGWKAAALPGSKVEALPGCPPYRFAPVLIEADPDRPRAVAGDDDGAGDDLSPADDPSPPRSALRGEVTRRFVKRVL